MKHGDEYQMQIILGDSTYSRIKTEDVFKGNPSDPIVGSLGRFRIVSNCMV